MPTFERDSDQNGINQTAYPLAEETTMNMINAIRHELNSRMKRPVAVTQRGTLRVRCIGLLGCCNALRLSRTEPYFIDISTNGWPCLPYKFKMMMHSAVKGLFLKCFGGSPIMRGL